MSEGSSPAAEPAGPAASAGADAFELAGQILSRLQAGGHTVAVAESLTGWKYAEGVGQPLDAVFRIVNEQTRKPVENPVHKVSESGRTVGLANHSVLIAKDGTERPIDDSVAPIRCNEGQIVGYVLVFREVTGRRAAGESEKRDI